ncbi:RraA family protein [Streptomyces huasconensis]|uniref:RraA family protein n=1 Tax=Streptomyces huasconensis TaxID=1854574 RepID=UPI0036F8CAB3
MTDGGLSTCAISDVLDGLGEPNRVLDTRLRRLAGGFGMLVGTALTVSWVTVRKGERITAPSPSTWAEVRDFLLPGVTAAPGQVYVAGAGDLITHAALAGGLSLAYLGGQLGFAGLVLGGAIRDRTVVESSDVPVVATNFTPVDTQGAFRVHTVGESCLIRDVFIRTGDWIFSDGDGTVAVPARLVEEVLSRATEVDRREQKALHALRSGRSLPELIDDTGHI